MKASGSKAQGRAGEWFERLVELQARLRGKDGCPWDREQTHESLRTYLVEETYEVLEALESGDDAKIADELGDLLLQIVFHAQLARHGGGRFDITEVIERIYTKLVRRHPHVFGDAKAKTSAQVLKNWEQLKKEERQAENRGKRDTEGFFGPAKSAGPQNDSTGEGGEGSVLDGVPRTLPALLEAYQLTRRASHVGFDWESIEGVLEKMKEELAELRASLRAEEKRAGYTPPLPKDGKAREEGVGIPRLRFPRRRSGQAGQAPPHSKVEEEIGDLLFVAVNVARFLGADPEIALKKANRKFAGRFREMERRAGRQGRKLSEMKIEEMEELWQEAKRQR